MNVCLFLIHPIRFFIKLFLYSVNVILNSIELQADAMRDQVGFPKYINNHTRFERKYHKVRKKVFMYFKTLFVFYACSDCYVTTLLPERIKSYRFSVFF